MDFPGHYFRGQVWSRLMGLNAVGDGGEGADAEDFGPGGVGEGFGGGDADAEAGEGAGAESGGDEADLFGGDRLGCQQFGDGGGERLGGAAVGGKDAFGEQAGAVEEGRGAVKAGSIEGED